MVRNGQTFEAPKSSQIHSSMVRNGPTFESTQKQTSQIDSSMVRNGPITATAHRTTTVTTVPLMTRVALLLRRRATVAILLLLMTVALPPTWVVRASVQRSEGDSCLEALRTLYQHWDSAYGLQAENPFPPSAISLPPDVPPAPHLEDCEARTAFRLSTEKRGKRGEPPYWAVPNPACGNVPQPPWVRAGSSVSQCWGNAVRLYSKKRGKWGEPPFWAVPNPACGNVPQPPWVSRNPPG
ncbi:unnamed protein product [Closterium sp. NIES-53]